MPSAYFPYQQSVYQFDQQTTDAENRGDWSGLGMLLTAVCLVSMLMLMLLCGRSSAGKPKSEPNRTNKRNSVPVLKEAKQQPDFKKKNMMEKSVKNPAYVTIAPGKLNFDQVGKASVSGLSPPPSFQAVPTMIGSNKNFTAKPHEKTAVKTMVSPEDKKSTAQQPKAPGTVLMTAKDAEAAN